MSFDSSFFNRGGSGDGGASNGSARNLLDRSFKVVAERVNDEFKQQGSLEESITTLEAELPNVSGERKKRLKKQIKLLEALRRQK